MFRSSCTDRLRGVSSGSAISGRKLVACEKSASNNMPRALSVQCYVAYSVTWTIGRNIIALDRPSELSCEATDHRRFCTSHWSTVWPVIAGFYRVPRTHNMNSAHHLAVTDSLTDRPIADKILLGRKGRREICDVPAGQARLHFFLSRFRTLCHRIDFLN